jgi:hypothetical protein
VVDLDNASGGTFRLAFAGETTAVLDYDATAAEVDAALEELHSLNEGHRERFGWRSLDRHVRGRTRGYRCAVAHG